MKISEIMSKNPRSVSPDTPVSEAARLMKEEDVGLVPVVERVGGAETRGRLVGVVTDRDIAIRHVAEGRAVDAPVSDVMSGGVKTCSPDDSVEDAMALMGREQVRRIPIVDESRAPGASRQGWPRSLGQSPAPSARAPRKASGNAPDG